MTTPIIYPLDYTGTLSSNFIRNEVVALGTQKVRAFTPVNAPFFKKSLVIKDNATGTILTEAQYKCYNLVSAPSAIAGAGNEVYAVVVVTDQNVSSSLYISYQTVGGDYCVGFDAAVTLINNLVNDSRPISWANVENLPAGFDENLHLHTLGDTVGWEFLAAELEQLRLALLLGDQLKKDFVLKYIDSVLVSLATAQANLTSENTPFGNHVTSAANPHNVTAEQLGLGNVRNYATATIQQALAGTEPNLYVTADQIRAIVQNAINLGIDAHILRTDNPHQVTKAQVGLDLVQNYAVATAEDLDTPVESSPKYVTNIELAHWLSTYFANQALQLKTESDALHLVAEDAKTLSQSMLDRTNDLNSSVQSALTLTSTAIQTAQAAVVESNQALVSSQSSETAAVTLLQDYVVQAVAAATSDAYARGYQDGVKAK